MYVRLYVINSLTVTLSELSANKHRSKKKEYLIMIWMVRNETPCVCPHCSSFNPLL